MQEPPIPSNEQVRQAHVYASGVLKLAGDKALQALVARAAQAFDAPIAAITIVDRERQFFPASIGIDVDETSRDVSFCAHGIAESSPLFCVPDATQDIRFVDHPAVTGPMNVRFYAGVPLTRDEDVVLGMLCVVDTKPRPPLNADEESLLRAFGEECIATMAAVRSVDDFAPESISLIIEQIRVAAATEDEDLLTELDRVLQQLERELAAKSGSRPSRLRPLLPSLSELRAL